MVKKRLHLTRHIKGVNRRRQYQDIGIGDSLDDWLNRRGVRTCIFAIVDAAEAAIAKMRHIPWQEKLRQFGAVSYFSVPA
jgi:hypothetical protein